MDAVKLTGTLTRPIEDFPGLDRLVGSEIEMIVLVIKPRQRAPQAGTGRDHLELKPGWDDPIDDFEDYV